MTLQKLLRMDYSKHIRPLFIKDKCEVCGSTENLELHHKDMFSDMLNDALSELSELSGLPLDKIDINDINNFTNNQLQLIRKVMLGKQLSSNYHTLCEHCHTREHTEIDKKLYSKAISEGMYKSKYGMTKDEYEVYYSNKRKIEIEEYLQKCIDENVVFLTLQDRKPLIDIIDIKENGRQMKSLNSINDYLKEINSIYRISTFMTNRKSNDKIKKYRSAWKIVKTN